MMAAIFHKGDKGFSARIGDTIIRLFPKYDARSQFGYWSVRMRSGVLSSGKGDGITREDALKNALKDTAAFGFLAILPSVSEIIYISPERTFTKRIHIINAISA